MSLLEMIPWVAYVMIIFGALSKSKIIMWIGLFVYGLPIVFMIAGLILFMSSLSIAAIGVLP